MAEENKTTTSPETLDASHAPEVISSNNQPTTTTTRESASIF